MKRIRLINLILIMFCCCNMLAQNITVTGQVVDVTSEPIIGASVVVKGTTNGTITDFDGNFTLSVQKGETLHISYIGYVAQDVKVMGNQPVKVVMAEDTETLDEVVVVGTSMKKSDLTGAVASVSSKVLEEKPVTNVNQALQGRVAGVFISQPTRPTDDASIKIRGINTINGSTDPIYVIDGMVMDNSFSGFNAVNLNDVASIEVLKDASATALYGSRGSNGVVVITTKKGKKGEGKVSYDGWIGFQTYANTPKTMNTRQLFELRKEAYTNGYMQTNPDGDVNAYVNDVIMGSNTVFADYEFDAYDNNKNYDWLDAVSRTGVQHNHVVSLSNGNDKGSYYISFGYTDNKGVIEKSEQEKYTGRINADQQIKSWLKVGTNTTFTRTENTLVDDGVMNRARCANPMLEISDEIETLNWQGIFDQNNFNPLRSLKVDNDLVYNRLLSSNYININPIEGLNLRSTFSIDYAQKQQNKYTPNDIYESERYGTQGEAKDDRDTRTVWQWDNSLSYEVSFGKHKLNAMVGTSATRTTYNYINATATGFGTNLFGYHSLGSGYKKDQRGLSTAWSEQTLLSYIARVNYNYAGKYLLTATARYDGSSKFAKGNQWGIFPSVSAAWNITEEKFMKNQTIFDQLKLRAGFGIVGNQNIDDFAYLSLITFPEVDARYVRMFGTELGWWFGYSLWSFDVLGGTQPSEGLSDVHFIRLTLKDKSGKIVSENNYWRGNDRLDFTALNTLPKAELKTSSKLIRKNGEAEIQAAITLPKSAKGVAFAVHVQAVRASDGERILPALMNDNYFTLMPGETKNLSITFDENLLQGDKYKLVVTPYNNK